MEKMLMKSERSCKEHVDVMLLPLQLINVFISALISKWIKEKLHYLLLTN